MLFDEAPLAKQAFGNDAPWYLANIPFLEIDDPDIQRAYYYRWQVYRSHLRQIGAQGTDETEFLASVPWARHPFEDLNDSSSFHILEGRWLRDPRYVTSLIDHLYSGGGNDRHFSESIAAATLGWVQVTGDPAPALRHLDAMEYVYNAWNDHFDAARGMYWIEPLLDATEYSIASIDASGAGFSDTRDPQHSGFSGGFSFRPSFNSYQYGNARAIAALAEFAGSTAVAKEYDHKAEALRKAVLDQLWNPKLQHFTDVYQRATSTVRAGDFVRGRELVGYVPWQFELPPVPASGETHDYSRTWNHLYKANELAGAHGLRTAEPTYARYLVQYRYDAVTGLPECQWNGPSWPFQTSQTLTAMANLLNDYPNSGVSSADYVRLLRQYTSQHYVASGALDIQEDYNPDTGVPIVGLPRSHHYEHSTYVDLVLSGLLGVRPRSDDVLEINPLLLGIEHMATPIRYFALQGLRYHGYEIDVVFDYDGSRYHHGAGLSIFVDGAPRISNAKLGRILLPLARKALPPAPKPRVDLAVNVFDGAPSSEQASTPIASSSSSESEQQTYEAIDGRLWFFPECPHGWSPSSASSITEKAPIEDWYDVDLREVKTVGSVELAFFSDGVQFEAPEKLRVQVRSSGVWKNLPLVRDLTPLANGVTVLQFPPTLATELRVYMKRSSLGKKERLVALEVYAP